MELRQVDKDVYACLQPDRGFGWSNSGLVNRGAGLVVDTFWDEAHTRRLAEEYARVRSSPVRQVFNTHHNGDHCWGNQVFEDAEIIAHRACAERFEADGSPSLLQGLKAAKDGPDAALAWFARELDEWDFSTVRLVRPTRTFDEELSLDVGGLEVRLIFVGPAHTAGDAVAWLPERGVLFTGDVLFRLCTPISWEGTFAQWIAALERLRDLGPEVVVPGHGPLTDTAGLEELGAYLRFVRARAAEAHARGLSLVDACKRIDLGPYADWTQPERLVFNVARAYRELDGQAWDAPIDVMQLFRDMHAYRLWRGDR